MPFARPTLTSLRTQAQQDILNAGIPGIDAMLTFSVLTVVTWVQAMFAWLHYGYLDWIALQSNPATATDEYLLNWGALKGLPRKQAGFAVCPSVSFPAIANGVIPQGTVINRSDGWAFVSTAASVVSGGQSVAPIVATTAGASGNAATGTLMRLGSPVPGVQTSGALTAPATGGADIETEDDYRSRVLEAFQAAGSDGAAGEYQEWATEVPGVTRAWVNPNGYGPGTVVVYVMLDNAESASGGFPVGGNGVAAAEPRDKAATGDQLAVANAIYPVQPVTALVYLAAPSPLTINLSLLTAQGLTSAVTQGIQAALSEMFLRQGTPLGMVLYPSDWNDAIASVPGVGQFEVTVPSGPIQLPVGQLPELGTLTVTTQTAQLVIAAPASGGGGSGGSSSVSSTTVITAPGGGSSGTTTVTTITTPVATTPGTTPSSGGGGSSVVVPAGAYVPQVFDPATMQGQDFTSASAFNSAVFSNVFTTSTSQGGGFYWSHSPDGLWIVSSQNATSSTKNQGTGLYNWPQTGFEQAYTGPSAGFGHGTFHFRMRQGQLKQGPGCNLILWRADGKWLDPSLGGQYTEIDIFEAFSSNGVGTCTLHYYSATAANNNGQVYHTLTYPPGTDSSDFHDYNFIWGPGYLSLYLDGVLQFTDTSARVPVDYKNGDCNRTLGAQVVVQVGYEVFPTLQMMLSNCWWSPSLTPPQAAAVSTTPASTVISSGGNVATGLSVTMAVTSTTSGTALAAKITATNGVFAAGAEILWAVFTNTFQARNNYTDAGFSVVLDANGTATIDPVMIATGDFVQVEAASNVTVSGYGPQVTITGNTAPVLSGATAALSISFPGGNSVPYGTATTAIISALVAPGGAVDPTAAGATVLFAVFSGSPNYQARNNYTDPGFSATIGPNGTASISVTPQASGDFVQVHGVNSAGATVTAFSPGFA